MGVVLDDLIQLNDVRMPDQLQNLNLPRNPLNIALIVDLVLLKDLDGHLLPSRDVDAQLHFPEGSLAQPVALEGQKIKKTAFWLLTDFVLSYRGSLADPVRHGCFLP